MAVLAFVRPEPRLTPAPPARHASPSPETRLRRYGRALKFCFITILAAWLMLQTGCLLSLFLHFQSGIVAGTIDGTLAFKFWPAIEYFSPYHAVLAAFVPHLFPAGVALAYAIILLIASLPFCAALACLARLFDLYAHGKIFTRQNAITMRRIGHCIMATGYSPLLLGPAAHAIGVLKPITGVTNAMIAFVLLGLILLAIAHVMEIGQQIQQEQEQIL